MLIPASQYISAEDYLSMEARAAEKHEYFEGRIYAMAGAALNHNYIVSNLTREISVFLNDKSCDLFGSDLRIATPAHDSYLYPDLSIICGNVELQDSRFDSAVNPSVIIEVMSPSTKGFDMAFKFYYYKQIPSLREYILVDSTRYFVQANRRRDEGSWEEAINIEDVNTFFNINAIDMQISLADVYRKVSFS